MSVKCPYCDRNMVERNGKRGKFYGCSAYPNCKGTRDMIVYPETIKLAPGSPEQERIWDWLQNGTENGLIEAKAGSGKAQPFTAKVLTPNGWKTMGSLQVGDAVTDPDGGIGYVEAIFPQGRKEVFEVTFCDGAKTQCCDEHLWLTQTVVERANHKDSVKNLATIRKTLKVRKGKRNNHYIPITKPVALMEKKLPIDPYLLGVLLGNGQLGKAHVYLSTGEEHIAERVQSLLPQGCVLTPTEEGNYAIRGTEWHVNALLFSIRDLGLSEKLAEDKFIPSDYLFNAKKNRLAILQGLLDTDGYAGGYSIEYSTASPFLAEGVKQLVLSLGGTVTTSIKEEPTYTYKGEKRIGQRAYRVFVKLPSDIAPFTLPRKKDDYIPRTKYQPYRNIESINSVGKAECQCIKVSTKRNLYVTDDYIVTHNTYTIVNAVARLRGVKVGIFSFNNHIIKEMNEQLTKEGISWARGSTYNSFGARAIRNSHLNNAELFKDKLNTLVTEMYPASTEEGYIIRSATERLARLCKCYMEDGEDPAVLEELVEKFNIEINGDCNDYEEIEKRTDYIFDLVPQVLKMCLKRQSTYDFDDQVWWVVKMGLPVEKFDICLVDEAQDTNKMQQKLIELACP